MWNLTKEKKEQILKERDEKKQELKILQGKTEKDLWKEDISQFLEEVRFILITRLISCRENSHYFLGQLCKGYFCIPLLNM